MNICDVRSHEEIVYTGRGCPLCAAIDMIDSLNEEINELENP